MITREMSAEERLQYCQSVIQAQQDSGLSVTAFCSEHKIPKARFYRYRAIVQGKDKPGEAEGGVYKVPNLEVCTEQQGIVLEAKGVRVHLGREADVELACRILRAMQ